MRLPLIVSSIPCAVALTACGSDKGGVAAQAQTNVDAGAQPWSDSGVHAQAALPACVSDGQRVVIIGDSYVSGFQSPPMQPELEKLLVADGAITGYRNYGKPGTSMGSGGTGLIPPQWDLAVAADPKIDLVIMDGGGNDLLIVAPGSPDCKNMVGSSKDPGCIAIVTKALDAAGVLITKMADAGVKDVVYFFYPHLAASPGGFGGTNANEMLDYAYPLAAESCTGAWEKSNHRLNCHWVEMRNPFEDSGAGAANFVKDLVHPSAAGQTIISREVYKVMKSSCLGQPVTSGCCTP